MSLTLKFESSFLVVCSGAQEIFKLLPHTFVDPSKLSELHKTVNFHKFGVLK